MPRSFLAPIFRIHGEAQSSLRFPSGHRTSRPQGLRERSFVKVIKFAAYRQAVGELGNANREALQPLRNVMCGGLPFESGIHRKNNFVDPPVGNAGHKRGNCQIFGTDAFQCRQASAQNLIPPVEQSRAIQRPQVCHFLYHADRTLVAARIGTDAARVARIDIAAGIAFHQPFANHVERFDELGKCAFASLDKP